MEGLAWLKPLVVVVWLAILLAFETATPMYTRRGSRGRHGVSNFGLGFLNLLLIGLPLAGLLYAATDWAADARFGLLHWLTVPAWLQWGVALVLFDAWMYGWHRLNHRVRFLWQFHSVHHTDREMDVTSAFRFHPGEILLSTFARLAVLPLVGISMPQLLVYESLLLPVIMFHHSNVRVPRKVDSLLRWLIVTPWMHWVHHSRERIETNSNYASVLSVWDRVFRSYRFRPDPEAIEQGLHDRDGGLRWHTLRDMLMQPFRSMTERMEARAGTRV